MLLQRLYIVFNRTNVLLYKHYFVFEKHLVVVQMWCKIQKKNRKSLKINDLRFKVYPEPGSNRHGLLHWCLRPARLPIPPSGLFASGRVGESFCRGPRGDAGCIREGLWNVPLGCPLGC